MPIPDSFDPTMMLGDAKNAGSPDAANATPGDQSRGPAGVQQFNGAANLGTVSGEPMPLTTFGTPPDNGQRLPQGVDSFNGGAV